MAGDKVPDRGLCALVGARLLPDPVGVRVLLMSSDADTFDTTKELLESGGCEVVRCRENPTSTFVCSGFVGRCPIDEGVAAAVVTGDGSHHEHAEDGASCAVRRRVPLVVAGDLPGHPYGQWAAAEVRDPRRHLLAALREVTAGASPEHSAVAQAAADALIRRWSSTDMTVRAVVHRSDDGSLRAELHCEGDVPEAIVHSLADSARGKLRVYDADAPSVDVSVITP